MLNYIQYKVYRTSFMIEIKSLKITSKYNKYLLTSFLFLTLSAFAYAISNNQNFIGLLGQVNDDLLTPVANYSKIAVNNGPNKFGFNAPTEVAIDNVGNRLFVSDVYNSRVLVYNLLANGNLSDNVPDFVLGRNDFINGGSTDAS